MRRELLRALVDIKDIKVMINLILNMNIHDVTVLFSLLEFTDEYTKDRWMTVYSDTFKLT
jgi:hypothetical protein